MIPNFKLNDDDWQFCRDITIVAIPRLDNRTQVDRLIPCIGAHQAIREEHCRQDIIETIEYLYRSNVTEDYRIAKDWVEACSEGSAKKACARFKKYCGPSTASITLPIFTFFAGALFSPIMMVTFACLCSPKSSHQSIT